MPSLWEGDLLYMPITVPGISITTATDVLTRQGQAIKKIPEVEILTRIKKNQEKREFNDEIFSNPSQHLHFHHSTCRTSVANE